MIKDNSFRGHQVFSDIDSRQELPVEELIERLQDASKSMIRPIVKITEETVGYHTYASLRVIDSGKEDKNE